MIFFDTAIFLTMVALILIFTSGWAMVCALAIFLICITRYFCLGLLLGAIPVPDVSDVPDLPIR